MGLVASPPGLVTGGAACYLRRDLIGAPYRRLRAVRGHNVAYVFQHPLATLHPLYRIGDQLVEAIRAHRPVSAPAGLARAVDLLDAVRNPNAESRVDDYPHEMSGGMRQRLGIAMALANDPHLIIADEPVSTLDVSVQAQVLNRLADLKAESGLTHLFTSHDLAVVEAVSDRIAALYFGSVVELRPAGVRSSMLAVAAAAFAVIRRAGLHDRPESLGAARPGIEPARAAWGLCPRPSATPGVLPPRRRAASGEKGAVFLSAGRLVHLAHRVAR